MGAGYRLARLRFKRQEDAGQVPVGLVATRPLGEILVEAGLVDHARLVQVLETQPETNSRLGVLLVGQGLLDERLLAWALAQQFSLHFADLREEGPDEAAISAFPEALARKHTVLPLRQDNGTLIVATSDPSDATTLIELARETGSQIQAAVAPESEIRNAIDNAYKALSDVGRLVKAFQSIDARRRIDLDARTDEIGEDAPVVQVVNMIVTQGLRDRASDIHVELKGDRVVVRFRIDGALVDAITLPASMGPAVVSRIKIMAGMNIVERQRPLDGQMSRTIDDRAIDIRVSTTPTIFGEKAVLRLLDKSRTLYKMDQLGMPVDTFSTFRGLVHSPFGMIICAGPTGSGKTTTLYASLAEVDTSGRNVMTIEDPVEYIFPAINQIQIKEQAGVTFAGGLKSILRQDPDIILVGEMRDVETARIAVQSALTGHLVLSSVHATDAPSALHRFLDMGIESFLVASSVLAVVGQRLVRRICGSCRVPYEPTPEELAFYQQSGGKPKSQFWHGQGCNFCARSGYRDRIGVYELLQVTEEIKSLIIRGAAQSELRDAAIRQGMQPLRTSAMQLIESDITTIAEVVRSIYIL